MKTVEFLFGSGFDTTTVRTVTGHFIFTGRAAAKVVGIARHRALIVVKPTGSPPDVLQVRINPRVRAGMLNEQLPFKVYVGNKGTEAAIGCAIRGNFNHAVRVEWQEDRPGNRQDDRRSKHACDDPGEALAPVCRGRCRTGASDRRSDFHGLQPALRHRMRQHRSRQDYPSYGVRFHSAGRIRADAALDQNDGAQHGGSERAGGGAKYRVTVRNLGPTGTILALPSYVAPFGESGNKQFGVKICQTQRPTSGCLAPPAERVQFLAPTGATRNVLVSVTRPAADPGFDPDKRRVFVRFNQLQPSGLVQSVTRGGAQHRRAAEVAGSLPRPRRLESGAGWRRSPAKQGM